MSTVFFSQRSYAHLVFCSCSYLVMWTRIFFFTRGVLYMALDVEQDELVLCGDSGRLVFLLILFWSFFQGSHFGTPIRPNSKSGPPDLAPPFLFEIAGVISQETKCIKNDATKCWCNKGGHITLNKKKGQTVAVPCTCLLSNPVCAKFDWLQTLELPKQHSF